MILSPKVGGDSKKDASGFKMDLGHRCEMELFECRTNEDEMKEMMSYSRSEVG